MASRINRAEQMLNNLVARTELTPSGRDWLIAAIDPFHDLSLPNLCGFPDQQVGASVISCVPQQFTISKPEDLTAGKPYNAYVQFNPWTVSPDISDVSAIGQWNMYAQNSMTPTGALNQIIYPITTYYCDSGNDAGLLNPDSSVTKSGTGLPNKFTKGPYRIIGCGFEIRDTTADIYKQGAITVYRQNTNVNDVWPVNVYNYPGSASYWGTSSVVRMRCHPQNLNEAQLLPGTLTWEAEKGAYIVPVMNSSVNPARVASSLQPLICDTDPQNVVQQSFSDPWQVMSGGYYSSKNDSTGSHGFMAQTTRWGFIPYHMCGAMLTGLNENSTFTVTVRYYVERFPSADEEDFAVMAKPSANYDPFALEFYDRMLVKMPVAVPVDQNSFGDWFNGLVKSVSSYVTPIAKAFGGPIGNTVANVSQQLNDVSSQQVAEAKRKRKKKKQKMLLQQRSDPPQPVRLQPKVRMVSKTPPQKTIPPPPRPNYKGR